LGQLELFLQIEFLDAEFHSVFPSLLGGLPGIFKDLNLFRSSLSPTCRVFE